MIRRTSIGSSLACYGWKHGTSSKDPGHGGTDVIKFRGSGHPNLPFTMTTGAGSSNSLGTTINYGVPAGHGARTWRCASGRPVRGGSSSRCISARSEHGVRWRGSLPPWVRHSGGGSEPVFTSEANAVRFSVVFGHAMVTPKLDPVLIKEKQTEDTGSRRLMSSAAGTESRTARAIHKVAPWLLTRKDRISGTSRMRSRDTDRSDRRMPRSTRPDSCDYS